MDFPRPQIVQATTDSARAAEEQRANSVAAAIREVETSLGARYTEMIKNTVAETVSLPEI